MHTLLLKPFQQTTAPPELFRMSFKSGTVSLHAVPVSVAGTAVSREAGRVSGVSNIVLAAARHRLTAPYSIATPPNRNSSVMVHVHDNRGKAC